MVADEGKTEHHCVLLLMPVHKWKAFFVASLRDKRPQNIKCGWPATSPKCICSYSAQKYSRMQQSCRLWPNYFSAHNTGRYTIRKGGQNEKKSINNAGSPLPSADAQRKKQRLPQSRPRQNRKRNRRRQPIRKKRHSRRKAHQSRSKMPQSW